MRAAHTYRGARRNVARDIAAKVPGGKMRDYFEPRVKARRQQRVRSWLPNDWQSGWDRRPRVA